MSKARDSVEDLRSIATVDDAQTFTADQSHGDNVKAKFGAGDDLEIYHDGANSYVSDAGTGNLNIQSNGTQINIQKPDGTKMIEAVNNGNVVLYSNGVERIRTNGTGVDVTGNVSLPDNGKATFGAGDDLQIYHDGTDSIIKEVGTGHLRILAEDFRLQDTAASETYITAAKDGAVGLRYNDSEKLATTSSGVDISGTVTATGFNVFLLVLHSVWLYLTLESMLQARWYLTLSRLLKEQQERFS